ncbi:MAG: ammonium transporter [Cytophagaceae bacterium]|nr:ammonium transporter [Cytophagaceae bacterium]
MSAFILENIFLTEITTDTLSAITAATDSLSVLQQDLRQAISESKNLSVNLWILLSAILVFMMNLGFGCIETGLIRSKNATNVLFKSIIIPVIAIITFSLWGFNIMFPGAEFQGGFAGFGGLGLNKSSGQYNYYTFFLFQILIACVSTCIIAGAVAERIKFSSFIIFSFFFLGIIYPLTGMWHWGGGWLNTALPVKFHDFGGATMVHAAGGWAALVGAAMLGPRIGKYIGGKIMPIPGHNMALATVGIFMIWIGWFGFIGGTAFFSDPDRVPYVILITCISAAAGCFGAFISSYLIYKVHDITMSMNGILAGLVAISASADIMNPYEALVIGVIAGLSVVFGVLFFDKIKVDDPMGAISAHLLCGTWGTFAVGIFGPLKSKEQFITQIIGVIAVGVTISLLSFIIFFLIKKFRGLRSSYKEEQDGLDLSEHGMRAYNLDFER